MYLTILISLPLLIITILISFNRASWKLWGKKEAAKEKKKRAVENTERNMEGPLEEETLLTDFMVSPEESKAKEMEIEEESITKIYEPGAGDQSVERGTYYPPREDSDHILGHEVLVKEIPQPLEEEVDHSWIDLDIKRDLNKIFSELERKKMNCYDILEVPESASKDEIRKAYRKLASKYHPDKGEVLEGTMMDRIREINYSKEILLDPTLRALHDEKLRQGEMSSEEREVKVKKRFDPSLLGMFPEKEVNISEDVKMSSFVESEDPNSGVGVLFFRKWREDLEDFGEELMDYIIELDEQGFIDYGQMMKGDVDDIEDVTKLRKISNFPMAVNNSLLEVWQRPPFYYLAVPIVNKDHVQEICDILKESFGLDSVFFSYPKI